MAASNSSVVLFHPNGQLRLDLFVETAATAVRESVRFARDTRWESVRSPHLFMGVLAVGDEMICDWCDRLGANRSRLLEQFREIFRESCVCPPPPLRLHREFISDNALRVLRAAYQRCQTQQRGQTSTTDLLICVLTTPHSVVADCFAHIGVPARQLTELAVLSEQSTRVC